MNFGLLLIRLVVGPLMAAHGAQKLFGWFGGHGMDGTAGFFEALGFRPGRAFAALAAATEVVSGVLVAVGLFGPFAPALMLSVMVVAAISVHWANGLFAATGGIEVPLLYAAMATGLIFTGPGAYSLDGALGLSSLLTPVTSVIALAIAVVAAFGNLALRRTAEAAVRV